MLGGIIAGAILSWVTIISELSSTIVLYPPGWSTMIVEIFQGVISDEMGTASALSLEPYTLYLTPCALCLSAISLLALRHVYPVKFEDHLTGAPGLEPLHQRTVTNREAIFLDILRR